MGRKPEGAAEKLFKNLGKKLDQLVADVKKGTEDTRFQERYEELKRTGEKLKEEFDTFKDDNRETFNQVEESFEKAGKEIRDAFNKTFSKGDK